MLISRETDYSIRILRSLGSGEKFTADELCKKELLPNQFAYKILKRLQKAGIVEILRGAEGGFRLNVDLQKMSVYDLVEVMQAGRLIGSCMDGEFECDWRKREGKCKVHNHLGIIQKKWDDELKGISLHQLIFEDI